ncbi:hypothetical protein D3C73_973640 [compost metagenome]
MILHGNTRAILGVAEFFHLQPVAALGHQRRGLDLVPLQREQGIADGLRESDQRQGFITRLVLGFVEDDFHGAGHRLDAIAGDRMAGGADHPPMLVF